MNQNITSKNAQAPAINQEKADGAKECKGCGRIEISYDGTNPETCFTFVKHYLYGELCPVCFERKQNGLKLWREV